MSDTDWDPWYQTLLDIKHKWFSKVLSHHIAMVGCAIIVLLLSLTLAGASAPSMSNVYIMSVSYNNTPVSQVDLHSLGNLSTILRSTAASAQMEVRIGYFGNCFRTPDQPWFCSSHDLVLTPRLGRTSDPLDLIQIAKQMQDGVFFTGLIFSSIVLTTICFLLWASFPGWGTEHDDLTGEDINVKPYPSVTSVNVILTCIILAAMLSLLASLWQHTAAVAAASVIESIGHGSITTSIGQTAMALSWTACGLLFCLSAEAFLLRLSLAILSRADADD